METISGLNDFKNFIKFSEKMPSKIFTICNTKRYVFFYMFLFTNITTNKLMFNEFVINEAVVLNNGEGWI